MKKIILGVIALSTVTMAATGDSYINARIGGDIMPKYSEANNEGSKYLSDETKGVGGEVAIEYYKSLNNYLDLGLGLSYQKHSGRPTSEQSEESFSYDTNVYNPYYLGSDFLDPYGKSDYEYKTQKYSGGTYDSVPMYVTGKIHFGNNPFFRPYLKFNLGYSLNNINVSNVKYEEEGTNGQANETFSTKIKNGIYWAIGGGVEYQNVTIDLLYGVTKAKAEVEVYNNKIEADNDYSRLILSVGYKFNL